MLKEFKDNSHITVEMGKQHGSLARAGKVKGQTPKVEVSDRPKKPVGRKAKRLQYNRAINSDGTSPNANGGH